VPVVRRLRAKLKGQKSADRQQPLIEEAMRWRKAAADETLTNDPDDAQTTVAEALSDRVDRIAQLHGANEALQFDAVARGKATPFRALLDVWFEEGNFSVGYEEDVRRVLGRLEAWCAATSTMQSIEAIKVPVAGRFIHETYIRPKANHTTANKDISCLRSYWEWLGLRYGMRPNPWHRQTVKAPSKRHEQEEGEKRPFHDEEVRTLLRGIKTKRDWQFSLVSALSGLRIDEIGSLRVKDCQGGKITVAQSKTPTGKRTIPAHPALASLIAERTKGKSPNAYLFDELPEQKPGSKRGRSAPVTQSFSRERVRR
jgi:integrase